MFKFHLLILVLCVLASCSNGKKEMKSTIKYAVTDSLGTRNLDRLDISIQIPSKYTRAQLDTICAIIKQRNLRYKSLKLIFFYNGQPKNTLSYGYGYYPNDDERKTYTQQDLNGEYFELRKKD